MKKIMSVMGLLVFAFLLMIGVAKAYELPKTSWQVYTPYNNHLTVYSGADDNSGVCWEGKGRAETSQPMLEDLYLGQCTSK